MPGKRKKKPEKKKKKPGKKNRIKEGKRKN